MTETGNGTVNSTDTASFTIVVSNATGAGTAYGVVLSDTLPGGLAWTSDGGTISNGTLSDTIGNLAAGSSVTIHVNAVTPSGYSATLNNTATATPTNGSAASGSATDVVQAPSLSVTETGNGTVNSTDTASFTIVVSDATGAGTAYGVVLSDPLPDSAHLSWTSTAGTVSGGTLTDAIGSLLAGQSVTITVSAPTPSGYNGTLNNTATATPTNGAAASGSATDTVLAPSLSVTETGSGTVNSTDTVSFTIVVSNATGAGTAYGVVLSDPLPDSANLSWTSTAGTISGGTLTDAIGSLLAGQSVTITVSAPTPSGYSATLPNTATATPTNGSAASGSATDTVLAPSLSVTETGSGTVNSTDTASFTIVVSDATGAGTAYGVVLSDPLPDSAHLSWTSTAGTVSGGTLTDAIGSLLAGQSVTITVSAPTPSGYNGTLNNTATATPTNGAAASGSATDTVLAPSLSVTETGNGTVNSTDTVSFTIVVSDATGAGTAYGVVLSDPLPDSADLSWTSTAGTISGGTLTDAIGSLLAGQSVTITVSAPTPSGYNATLNNTATATPTNGAAASGSATDTVLAPNLSVTKVDNVGGSSITQAVGSVVPGTSFTYTITVSNAGPGTATNVAVSDPLPAGIASDTWSGNGQTNVSGAISDTIASLAPGAAADVVYTVTATVDPGATGQLVNTVTATAANGIYTSNNTATDKDKLTPQNDVGVTKTDNEGGSSVTGAFGTVVPGTSFTYTITASNAGPSTATGVVVSDPLPAGIASDTWSGSDGSSGTGTLSDTIASLAPSASVVYTVTAAVDPATTGQLVNTVTVTAANDTDPANNSATDTDTLTPVADLAITNTDGSPTYTLSNTVTYIVTVTNIGPSDAVGAIVADSIPAILTGVTWTSSATGTASVTSGGSGSGNSLAATANIAVGAGNSVVFTVSGTPVLCLANGDLVATATVTAPSGTTDPNLANNTAADIDTLSAGQMPITVNSAGDDPLGPSPGTVTLRDAINAVNLGTADAILFAIPGTPTITLAADLPALDKPVNIDGSTEPGVTVDGNGFAILDDSSTVYVNGLSFTNGTVTVEINGTLNVASDFNLGDSSTVNNYGSVDVCGSCLGGDSISVSNYNGAFFHVDGGFTLGDFSAVNQDDTAAMSVGGGFSMGVDGTVNNGMDSAATATLTVGGSFSIGEDGVLYNYGTSTVSVAGDFSLGDFGFAYNGLNPAAAATLTVGGSFSIGDSGFLYNSGDSKLSVTGDFSLGDGGFMYDGQDPAAAATFTVGGSFSIAGSGTLYTYGTSTASVAGNFTLGDFGAVFNGQDPTAAATLTVGGSFSIGDSGVLYNYGASTFSVTGDVTMGDGAFVDNGADPSGAGILTIGGNLSLGANSNVYDNGTSDLSVMGNFTLGDTSFFVDYGTMSVSGIFDPGTGDPFNPDLVSGTFIALPGSSVITNTATWEVLAGGHLDVAAGATFNVTNGGTLQVDDGGSVTVEGTFEVLAGGLLDVAADHTFHVATGGTLVVDGSPAVGGPGPFDLGAGEYLGS